MGLSIPHPKNRTHYVLQNRTTNLLPTGAWTQARGPIMPGRSTIHARRRSPQGRRQKGKSGAHTFSCVCLVDKKRPRKLRGRFYWLPDQGSNLGPADYNACAFGLSHHPRHDPLGCRALMGAYCLGCSLPSLCTFPPTACPSAGLAQDSSRRTFPEFTRFSFTGFPVTLPFDSPSLYRLSYRGSNFILCGPPDVLDLRPLRYRGVASLKNCLVLY